MGAAHAVRRSAPRYRARRSGVRIAGARAPVAMAQPVRADRPLHADHHLGAARILAPSVRSGDEESSAARGAVAARCSGRTAMTYLIVKWLHVLSSTVLFG